MSEITRSRIPIKFILTNVGEADGELIRHLAPRTVGAITKKLPLEGHAALWKEEVYFEIPLKMGEEKAQATVDQGTISYWSMGSALCVFYGNTQPYSPVNVVGQITKNLEMFRQVKSGTIIRVQKA